MDEMTSLEVQAEPEQAPAEEAAESVNTAEAAAAAQEAAELKSALLEANIRLALLLAGAAKEKLGEAEKLAEGLCAAGAAPAEAAAEIISCYPHLKAVKRELPQFAAQTGGTDDGFSLIRSIFARR